MIKVKNFLMHFLVISLLASCACYQSKVSKTDQDHLIAATIWIQNAAEVRALSYQAFNLARLQLDLDLKNVKGGKKRAVVVDVDETVVDNSPYQAQNILENKTYNSKSWGKWVDKAEATAIPGSLDFLNYAHKKGVEVFYITNRKIRGFDATYKNLKELGFPVKKSNLMLRVKDKGKTKRREAVLKDHRIVLFLGDNLGDFSDVFDNKLTNERFAATDEHSQLFGTKFIVLPNPMYGDWESAIYDYNFKLTLEEKESVRNKHLKTAIK